MNSKDQKSTFQFDNPVLLESVFFENLTYKEDFSKIGQLPFKINKIIGEKQKLDEDRIGAPVVLTLTTSEKMELDENTPCFIRVTMRANFVWNRNDFSEDSVDKLLSVNAPSLLLGYIRPKIVSLTQDSDVPTQQIPFINFSTSIDQNKNINE
ncbi:MULTISPECIES: protein-export chaperone SecB [Lactobacillus]|uniref:protein-export chaperone SecB n=1 Tax=Lactobacillus TaxID=1578 RepID=UPI0011DD84FD|nr:MULTISPECIES: protein-export chaperone SecB [Lactobacillus]MCR1903337.1 protein-export chaperone SecB [Lactobacillus taiwanensis]